jgi:FlaG/FlaF family flagellin (archaellin)
MSGLKAAAALVAVVLLVILVVALTALFPPRGCDGVDADDQPRRSSQAE